MPSFNLNKTAQAKILDKMLGDQQKETGTSIHGDTESIQGRLSDNRGEGQGENLDVITETQMDTPHEAATEAETVTENQLTEAEGHQTHRDPHVNDAIMKPNDAIAEAYHQKHKDAYAKDNKPDDETKFWDDFVGAQLEGDSHKVIASDPAEASQLANNPARFDNLSSFPTETDARENEKHMADEDKVRPLTMASVEEVDADLFGIFFRAASEDRELNSEEQEAIAALSSIKAGILAEIQRIAEGE